MDTSTSTRPQGGQVGRRGYEKRDASVGWIFGSVAFLAICVFTIHFIVLGFVNTREKTRPPEDQWQPAQMANVQKITNVVTLQVSPPLDLAAFRAREDAELTNYAWVNREHGIVRIPIEQAMDLLVHKGLPTRTAEGKDKVGPSEYELQLERAKRRE